METRVLGRTGQALSVVGFGGIVVRDVSPDEAAAHVAEAVEKGTGILALKALAKRPWREGEERQWPKCWYSPVDTLAEAKAALAFTLSKPVTAAVSPSHAELLWLACDAVDALAEASRAASAGTALEGEAIFRTDV